MRKTIWILLLVIVSICWYWWYNYLNPVVTERTTVVSQVPWFAEQLVAWTSWTSWYDIVLVATWLEVPRAVAQTAAERLLVTERPGRVRQIIDGQLVEEPLLTITEISNKAEEGLMSIILDPDYQTNKYLYLCYVYKSSTGMVVKVVRYTDDWNILSDPFVVRDMLPAAQRHAWSALAFWPDGNLYITVWDAVEKDRAQSLDTYHGKILRIRSDGTIPEDNPFSGSAIRSYGHRNSQWVARTNNWTMYASEHWPSTFDGPPGGDELNRIVPWGNYGRPIVSHEKQAEAMISPIAVYTPAIAPASLLIYSWTLFPERNQTLFVGMLRGEWLLQLTIDEANPDQILSTTKLIDDRYGRIRYVWQWVDGSIYFTTSNEDGRGTKRPEGDGVYQIVPKIVSWNSVLTWSDEGVVKTQVGDDIPEYLNVALDGDDLQFERILEQNSVYIRYQISYLSDGLRISWIMNIPNWTWPYPLVILNHGYIDPAVYTNGRGLKREQDYLSRNWFAVLHTDYRNHAFSDSDTELITSPHLRTKKYWIDALNAIHASQNAKSAWYIELVNVDTENVGMLWHSMWWWVTMYSLVAKPWLVDAAVLYAPVHSHEFYNFNRWLKNRLDGTWYELLQNNLGQLEDKATFNSFSPETYFDRITAPVQIYFGTLDDSCPVERWREIRTVLEQNNKSVELIEYVWENHEFTKQWSSFMQWVVKFLWEQL